METMPTRLPPSTTGRCRRLRSPISWAAARIPSSAEAVSGFGVMTSRSSVVPNAAPLPASRNTSRSVKIPTGSGPSHTTTEPTPASSIVRIASAAVWSGLAVTSCVRITPPICIFHLHRRLVTNDTILHARVAVRLGSRQGSRPGRVGSRMAGVTFDQVTKTYADGTTAVNALDLEIEDGEFMVLVGPSGCGKTTALRMVAGLEDI